MPAVDVSCCYAVPTVLPASPAMLSLRPWPELRVLNSCSGHTKLSLGWDWAEVSSRSSIIEEHEYFIFMGRKFFVSSTLNLLKRKLIAGIGLWKWVDTAFLAYITICSDLGSLDVYSSSRKMVVYRYCPAKWIWLKACSLKSPLLRRGFQTKSPPSCDSCWLFGNK